MSRDKEVQRTEISKKVCDCGNGYIVTYRVEYENDSRIKNKTSLEKEIKCSKCNKRPYTNMQGLYK